MAGAAQAAPLFHAVAKEVRETFWAAYSTFVAAFREAAEKLKTRDPVTREVSGGLVSQNKPLAPPLPAMLDSQVTKLVLDTEVDAALSFTPWPRVHAGLTGTPRRATGRRRSC